MGTSNILDMSYIFYEIGYDASIFNIVGLDNLNVSSVTNIKYMFACAGYYAKILSIDDFSNWDV